MSWYSDREPFDEYDWPWCKHCKGGDSYEACRRCEDVYLRKDEDEDDEDD